MAEEVSRQDVRRGIGLGASSHGHLAEQHYPLALTVLQQGTVLEAVTAVEERQEIAPRGFLDQNRGDIASTAAAPGPRHVDAAPLDRRAMPRPQGVLETW